MTSRTPATCRRRIRAASRSFAASDTSSLTKTPESPSTAKRYAETRTYTLPEDGKAHVTEVTETVTGTGETRSSATIYAESDRTKWKEQIETYVKSYCSAKKLDKVEATDPHDLTKPFRITIEASDAETGIARDGDAAVRAPSGESHQLASRIRYATSATIMPKKREGSASESFIFPVGRLREWTYRIIPPPGYDVGTPCLRTRRRSSARRR